MKTIFRLITLAVGFFLGIYVGVHYQKQATQIDQIRADEQAKLQQKLQPLIEKAKAEAKIEVLDKVLNDNPSNSTAAGPAGRPGFVGSGFVGGSPAGGGGISGDKRAELEKEMAQATQQLKDADSKMKAAK